MRRWLLLSILATALAILPGCVTEACDPICPGDPCLASTGPCDPCAHPCRPKWVPWKYRGHRPWSPVPDPCAEDPCLPDPCAPQVDRRGP